MSKFKVVLEFHYDSDENIEDWNVDVPFKYVTSKEEAIQVAESELNNNSPCDFTFEVNEV